ncbi:hypothetical protein CRG98_016556 [Punica granatum]|uniref:Uncharacterized protein n=1 Tax=Punica granatum TaxID=22663 RepID=A0A2I0K3B3_PUNGR|nr:hypothetical protein CRG98_016556 [Punica granatum]
MMQCKCKKVNVRKINVRKAINKHASKANGSSLNPLRNPQRSRQAVRTRMWTLVKARIARFWIARLGSVHLPVGTRDRHAARLEFRTRLAQVGLDVATEAPDGIFEQGQRLPTANSPPEVAVVVVFRKESWIDPICKKTVLTVRNFDPTGQSGCFFFLGLNQRVFLGFRDSLTP